MIIFCQHNEHPILNQITQITNNEQTNKKLKKKQKNQSLIPRKMRILKINETSEQKTEIQDYDRKNGRLIKKSTQKSRTVASLEAA